MVKQDYTSYKKEDHNTWSLLFKRQNKFILNGASKEVKKGFKMLSLNPDKIANLEELNARIAQISEWSLVGVPGLIPDSTFLNMLSNKNFPVTVSMRKPEELAFSELPDIFHDVYGHAAMLLNETFSSFMAEFSKLALKHINDETAISHFGRLYWFTLEMGLIMENGELKPYGGAILTSSGEIENIKDNNISKHPFDLEKMIHTEYDNLKLQKEYFFIESFDQLTGSLEEMDALLCENIPIGNNPS